MHTLQHEPIIYSNKLKKSGLAVYVFSFILFTLLASILIISGVVMIFLEGDYWIASWFMIPSGLIISIIAVVSYRRLKNNKEQEYQFELNENGIKEIYLHKKEDTYKENTIPFERIEKLLIGNYVDTVITHVKRPNFYHFGALIVVIYNGNYFFHRSFNKEEVKIWVERFQEKKIPVHFSAYDLKPAFIKHSKNKISFENIESKPWGDIFPVPPIGEEDYTNYFIPWTEK